MINKHRILFIDHYFEWLNFAKDVLSEAYDLTLLSRHEDMLSLPDKLDELSNFKLIFIDLELARSNLDLLKPLFKQCHFVIMFPVIQENETVRLLFKAGVYDCVSKPYERESLLKLVADELIVVQIPNGSTHGLFLE